MSCIIRHGVLRFLVSHLGRPAGWDGHDDFVHLLLLGIGNGVMELDSAAIASSDGRRGPYSMALALPIRPVGQVVGFDGAGIPGVPDGQGYGQAASGVGVHRNSDSTIILDCWFRYGHGVFASNETALEYYAVEKPAGQPCSVDSTQPESCPSRLVLIQDYDSLQPSCSRDVDSTT